VVGVFRDFLIVFLHHPEELIGFEVHVGVQIQVHLEDVSLDVLVAAVVSQHLMENHTDFCKRNLIGLYAAMHVFVNRGDGRFELFVWLISGHAAILGIVYPREFFQLDIS